MHGAHHGAVQFVLRQNDPWCVAKHDLVVVAARDAEDAVACGLRLGRRDGELAPHEGIHQCRLARIGFADDAYKARFKYFFAHRPQSYADMGNES